ncbi:Aldo/keto reductase [Myxozyma melibiosi]|uniref:Aldo/keto reductase n=1 Tax=Myxozyma melibiosi TaxID=54550 RepID=A0ABR1EY46_9ASCO
MADTTTPLKAKYKKLGNSGLRLSVPILGCMSFGFKEWQPWVLEREDALPILKAAYDMGVTTWDTANNYSHGESERIIAAAIKKYNIPRKKLQILTKCYMYVDEENPRTPFVMPDPSTDTEYSNRMALSRAAIFEQVEASLARLETDYIDILQIHRFDYTTPIEETMCALHDLVQSGKVRYIGASSMYAFQFVMMQECAARNGWTKFISMQNQYSLLYREEEREMIQYCNLTGVGIIPWGPLTAGALAKPPTTTTDRSANIKTLAAASPLFYDQTAGEPSQAIISRVQETAEKKGITMAEVSLAWVMARVSSPIVGISSPKRLEEVISASYKSLTEEESKYLEEPYVGKPVYGFV